MASHDAHKAPESGVQQVGRAQSGQQFVQQVGEQGQYKSPVQISSEPATPKLAIARTQPEAARPAPKFSRVANAFPGGEAMVPNNPATAAVFDAIHKGGKRSRSLIGGWGENETTELFCIHSGRKAGRILVYPRLAPNPEFPLTSPERVWHYVEGLSPFTADVALAVLAQMCEPTLDDKPKFPMLQPVMVTAEAILRYKGIRRRGAERKALLRRVHDEMERLGQLYFDVELFPTFNPGTKRYEKVSWKDDRLFDIVKVEASASIRGENTDIQTVWLVRAGQWAYWWLSAEARVYLGRMARILLELDHRENSGPEVLAKKIGQRILFLHQAFPRQNPLTLRIGKLLENVGELPRPEARHRHWAGKTRENFEGAMRRLGPGDAFTEGINVFADVGWPKGYGPDDNDRVKGWPEPWLSASVSITMPCKPTAMRDNHATDSHRPRRQLDVQASLGERIGPVIRSARLNCEPFKNQEELARHLGISSVYLSLIETEKRLPSAKLATKLREWVEFRRSVPPKD